MSVADRLGRVGRHQATISRARCDPRFRPRIHTVEGVDICRAHVPPSRFPVDANVVVDKGGQLQKKFVFYIRVGNGTREVTDPAERQKYVASRWSSAAA